MLVKLCMIRGIFILLLLLHNINICGQVTYISGSYSEATATGSGAGGVPSLSYTASAGTDRLLLFFMIIERDHLPGSTGDNWASNAPTGGSVPTVELGSTTLSHLTSQWLYEYDVTDDESDAEISLELMVYGVLEANIPTGTNTFSLTANFNNPTNTGDDAIFAAVMFENVNGIVNLANSNCTSCNSISTSAISPDDGNNATFSVMGASGDRTITKGANQTLINESNVSNSNGNYTSGSFSEQDGISIGTQYRTGTILNSTNDFSASGSANLFGMLESAFRITSTVLLPVELINFSVKKSQNGNLLNWTTGSEINNMHFIIERSENGILWQPIDTVNGNGDSFSQINYHYMDANYNCSTCYYRLKQVDFDGTFAYSKKVWASSSFNSSLTVFPTISRNEVHIQHSENIHSVSLYSTNGKLVEQINAIHTQQFTLQKNKLKAGTYILAVKSANQINTEKIVFK